MRSKTPRGLLIAAGLFGFFTVIGLLNFGYKYLEQRISDPTEPWLPYLIDEMTGAYGAALLAPVVYLAVKWLRGTGFPWLVQIPIHLVIATAFSVLHTAWNGASRGLLYPLAGLGAHDYGSWLLRVPMEYFNDLGGYALWAVLLNLFFYYRETRDRELQAARLEAELSSARLRGLEARLNPHFLFNTLNVIASAMYRSVDVADRMITQLGGLLRQTLDSSPDGEITLAREVELLQAYAEIMEARFGERLNVRIDVLSGLDDAVVPSMILQPLVENSIEHGVAGHTGSGQVVVTAERDADELVLRVTDDGPGLPGDPARVFESGGIGLSTTRERLHQIYGADATLALRNRPEVGLEAVIRLPFREAPLEKPGLEVSEAATASIGVGAA